MRPEKLTSEDKQVMWALSAMRWTDARIAAYYARITGEGISRQTVRRAVEAHEAQRRESEHLAEALAG